MAQESNSTTSSSGAANSIVSRQVTALAEVYANSLFELAEEAGGLEQVDAVQQELQAIAGIARTNSQFEAFLKSRIISTSEKAVSLNKMFGGGRVSDLVLHFILVLNRKERLAFLGEIADGVTKKYWAKTNRVEVEVFSATPLDDSQTEIVRAGVSKALGKEPVLFNTVDSSVIGGLKLRIGDQMIDASVASQLHKMKEQLTTTGVDQIRSRLSELISG